MLLSLVLTVLSLQTAAADTLPRVSPEALASAYLDPDAREMVRLVRARRDAVDRSITAYQVTARERISVGLRAMRRDRVLFREETAARIHWRRQGVGHVEVLGARQVVPIATARPSVPSDARAEVAGLAFDPGDNHLLRLVGDDDAIRHPLAGGSEADYRFGSGDTTRIRLPDGRTIRLLELRLLPRRNDGRLLRGSFWLEAESHAPVRAVLQLVRPLDLERDLGEDDEDIPGVLKPIRGDLRFLTIDYGLWEQRWWLPRLVALEVIAQAGSLINIPVRFERSYSGYVVQGEGAGEELEAGGPAGPEPPGSESTGDSLGIHKTCYRRDSCWRYTVHVPENREELLHSEHLPPSIYAQGESLVDEGELRELAGILDVVVPGAGGWRAPELQWSYLRPDLIRYNRVEGLALGVRADADWGPVAADGSLWLGTADLEPSGELGVVREGLAARHRVAAYRRLAGVDPDPRALGLGGSLAALLLGRDDGDYYRTLGAELRGESQGTRGWDYAWRLFGERQTAADKSTDFSLPYLFDRGRRFDPNIQAEVADQMGGSLALRFARGLDPLGFRWGGEAAAMAQAGTYEFVRPSLSAFAGFPLPFRLVGALELAGGTVFGEVPVQSHWFLGGPATVRGSGRGSRIHGDTFWRSRAEVGSSFPGARLVVFSDAGWVGERAALASDPKLLSAGVGVSLLDGLLRLDLARALRGDSGWRLDVHLDAPL